MGTEWIGEDSWVYVDRGRMLHQTRVGVEKTDRGKTWSNMPSKLRECIAP